LPVRYWPVNKSGLRSPLRSLVGCKINIAASG
jgi:hypothetical protein